MLGGFLYEIIEIEVGAFCLFLREETGALGFEEGLGVLFAVDWVRYCEYC